VQKLTSTITGPDVG